MVAAAVFIFGSVAFAQESDFKQGLFEQWARHQVLALRERGQLPDFASRVRQKVSIIKHNRSLIKNLQDQANQQIRQIKGRIAELRKNPKEMDRNKIAGISQLIKSIGLQQQALESTQRAISRQNALLRTAIKNRKPALFLQALEEIIAVQEKRIEALNEMLADLNRLSKELG